MQSSIKNKQMLFKELLVLFYVTIVLSVEFINFYSVAVIGVCAFFSVVYVAVDLLKRRTCLKTYKADLLLLFTILNLISIAVNLKYATMENMLFLFTLFIDYLILYNCGGMDKEEASKYFKTVSHFFMAAVTVVVLFSLLTFLFGISRVYVHGNHGVRQGFMEGRLFGFFPDPNYAALSCLVVLYLSIYYMYKEKRTYRKVIYFYIAVFNACYVILCASRTGLLVLIASCFVGGFFVAYKIFENKPWKKLKKNTFCVAFAIILCIASVGVYHGGKFCLSYMPAGVKYVQSGFKIEEKKEALPVSLERRDVEEKEDISNNRFTIWTSAFRLITQKPLFGTSPRSHVTYAKSNFPAEYISITGYWTHNSILELALFSGVPAFFAIAIFLCCCANKAFSYLFKRTGENFAEVLLCVVIITTLLAGGMTLSGLFYNRGSYNFIFWFTLGYLMVYVGPKENNNLCLKAFEKIFPKKDKTSNGLKQ